MRINHGAFLICCLILSSSFSTPTYPMQFVRHFIKTCSMTAHKCVQLIKRNPKTFTCIALGATALLLIQTLKHRMIRECARFGRSLQYKFWHMLGGRIDPNSDAMRRAFFRSIQKNKIWLARQMLDDGITIDDSRVLSNGGTALHEATRLGHTDIARMLIAKHANVAAPDSSNSTPLHIAARKHSSSIRKIEFNRLEIARVLLDHGASCEAQDDDGYTPLHRAAYDGQHKVAALLLERGAHFDVRTHNNATPLHLAAFSGSNDIVKLLLERHADRDAVDTLGRTPFRYAQLGREKSTIELLKPILTT